MLLDIFSSSNFVTYNVRLAQMLGLSEAVYLGQLIDINKKAIKKGMVEENFISINRKYIKERTTISSKDQETIDEKLVKVGLIKKRDVNSICIDLNKLLSILCCDEDVVIEDINKVFKKESAKKLKQQSIIENLKHNVHVTNDELRRAYEEWIEAVYARDGWMVAKAVILAQDKVDAFANHNLDVALDVIDIATVNGYRDMDWAINTYKKKYKPNPIYETSVTPSISNPVVSEEVF